jgi:hypothetical protein
VSAFVGNNQLTAPQAACSTCTCNAPTGQSCSYNGTIDVVDATCNGTPNCGAQFAVPAGWDGSCYGPDKLPGGVTTCGVNSGAMCNMGTSACNVAAQMGSLTVSGGSCTASQQIPNIAPPAWGVAGEACGGAPNVTKGCNTGQSCMPKPQAPFHTGVCIQKGGDNACPPGQFSQKHLFYTSASDTRACSDCSCGVPGGGSCSATVTVYSATSVNTCTGLVATLNPTSTAGACTSLAGNPTTASRKATFSQVTGGACPASGGQPSGTVTPQSPTTFCCIP